MHRVKVVTATGKNREEKKPRGSIGEAVTLKRNLAAIYIFHKMKKIYELFRICLALAVILILTAEMPDASLGEFILAKGVALIILYALALHARAAYWKEEGEKKTPRSDAR